jgi:hypothetical protein
MWEIIFRKMLGSFKFCLVSCAILLSVLLSSPVEAGNSGQSSSPNPKFQAGKVQLPENAKKIYVVFSHPNKDVRVQKYGHIALLFSSGNEINENDTVVGFGPDIGESADYNTFRLLNIGLKPYPVGTVVERFGDFKETRTRQNQVALSAYELDLNQNEVNGVVDYISAISESGVPRAYNAHNFNCVTMACKFLDEGIMEAHEKHLETNADKAEEILNLVLEPSQEKVRNRLVFCNPLNRPVKAGAFLNKSERVKSITYIESSKEVRESLLQKFREELGNKKYELGYNPGYAYLETRLFDQLASKKLEQRLGAFKRLTLAMHSGSTNKQTKVLIKELAQNLIETEYRDNQNKFNEILKMPAQQLTSSFPSMKGSRDNYVKRFAHIISQELTQEEVVIKVATRRSRRKGAHRYRTRTLRFPLASKLSAEEVSNYEVKIEQSSNGNGHYYFFPSLTLKNGL